MARELTILDIAHLTQMGQNWVREFIYKHKFKPIGLQGKYKTYAAAEVMPVIQELQYRKSIAIPPSYKTPPNKSFWEPNPREKYYDMQDIMRLTSKSNPPVCRALLEHKVPYNETKTKKRYYEKSWFDNNTWFIDMLKTKKSR